MYGRGDSIECLSVSAWKIGGDMMVETGRVNVLSFVACLASGPLSASSSRCGEELVVRTKKTSSGLHVSVSPVCTVGKDYYLNVAPDVLWITPDMVSDAWFEIQSNVDWLID